MTVEATLLDRDPQPGLAAAAEEGFLSHYGRWALSCAQKAMALRGAGARAVIAAQDGNVKRALAAAHPDLGGEAEDFRDVIAARDA